ncbi:hypothetical protein MKX03_025266, partial [Papaver bracteatum]
ALKAKVQGKDVGILECEGAATTKCPWNAPELFDFSLRDGETIREWIFFDKPQREFESGTRNKRSLPDYSGRDGNKKRLKVKFTNDDPVAHMQKQMGKLTADVLAENKISVKSIRQRVNKNLLFLLKTDWSNN